MSRPGPSPPPALTPIASTSTAHLTPGSAYSGVRHRHDKEPVTYPPQASYAPSTTRPRRRKRREVQKKGRRFRWRRGVVTEAFRKFGEHCARNQIRTLLIDCLVMTNLFYPSMVLYLQKRSPPSFSPAPPPHRHKIPLHGEAGPSTYWRNRPEHPLSLLSTPVLESFFPYPPPLLPNLDWTGWWGRDTDRYNQEDYGWGLSRALPEDATEQPLNDEEIRIVRVAWADVEDVLDRDTEAAKKSWEERDRMLLRLVRDVAEEWEEHYKSTGEACIRQLIAKKGGAVESAGPCYVFSPESLPSTSELPHVSMLDSYFGPGIRANTSSSSLSVDPEHIYHSLGAIFRVTANSTSSFEARWQNALSHIAKKVEGEIFAEVQNPKTTVLDQMGPWYLSYTSRARMEAETTNEDEISTRPKPLSSSPPKIVLFLYFVLLSTLMAQISNASKVHSRFGLAFTGVVQLCCSTVMSFSVLALLGWNGWGASSKQSSLPTYVLPFVIVVVGAENMSTLTKAIFSIPFSHSVPVRIGLGLSKVGTTIALTSLTDLLVLGVVWVCVNLQPVREFCLFAAVVIITDWFMLHTFFLTVLSIDAQRLELADVLASNGGPPVSPVQQASDSDDQGENKQNGFGWRKLLRARTTKSGSLILLLLTCGFLYWLTERHRISPNTTARLYGYTPMSTSTTAASMLPQPTPFVTNPTDLTHFSPAEKLWRSLNPLGWTYIKIFVSPASILVLPKRGHSMRPADIRKLSLPASRLLLPRLRPLFYLFKVVVLPQAVTAAALYALLLYLLKDADLLDAQRDRLGRVDEQDNLTNGNESDSSTTKQQAYLIEKLEANMLPCSHESDIDIIATSSDGFLALSVGIDNSLCLWRFDENNPGSGTREILTSGNLGSEDPIVSSTISEDRTHIGVCTARGILQIWQIIEDGQVVPLSTRRFNKTSLDRARITAIAFDVLEDIRSTDPFTITPRKSSKNPSVLEPAVLVALSNGAVFLSNVQSDPISIINPIRDNGHSRISFIRSSGQLEILLTTSEAVQTYRKTESGWLPTTIVEATDDRITAVAAPEPALAGLWAVGHESGSIDLVDEIIGHLLSIPPNSMSEPIKKVHLAKSASMRCTSCSTVSTDGYLIIYSTPTHIYLDRVCPRTPNNIFCKCLRTRGIRTSLDEMSRPTNLFSPSRVIGNTELVVPPSSIKKRYTPGASPRKSPTLLPLPSNGEFPLSSHGGARRLSNLHKPDESVLAMTMTSNASMDRSSISGQSTASPAGDFEIQSLGAIILTSADEEKQNMNENDWEIINNHLIGIKRSKEGIDDSQWSILITDLSLIWNGFSINLGSIQLDDLLQKTKLENLSNSNISNKGISINESRKERINSLNGKASFSSINDYNQFPKKETRSFSVPTFSNLGYVEINQFKKFNLNSIIAGFGNKLGIIKINNNSIGKQKKDILNNISNSNNNNNNNINLNFGLNNSSSTTIIGLRTPTPLNRKSNSFAFIPPPPPPPPPSTNGSKILNKDSNFNVNSVINRKVD
ncbi:uncharacterized protein I206_102586 [Kwoniella pini CBS 10737]|uniref:Sterol regulatory element-binding protein cleavage-activating protein n=1 Tax=Kwoniella pini CBS 10737 TaxID=1296096 RepID=A0A1B9I5S5_9TREE|nr:uncharacterized protein I206_02938 [Kwoniella pini CBS 10737]OCF50880.1 hypothetical protein I206_02938 [Kwoniella pini CBS 10737]